MLNAPEISTFGTVTNDPIFKQPFILTTANIKLNVKGKVETRDGNRFIVSPRHSFFAFWSPKLPVFQDAQVVPLSLFQTFDYDDKTRTYKSSLSDGTAMTLIFADSAFIETFNKILSSSLAAQSHPVDEPKEYFRYLLGALEDSRKLERSLIIEPDIFCHTAGNLTQVLAQPAFKPFSYVVDESKETIFRGRTWLGMVKVSKHNLDKSIREITDGISKAGKPGVLLIVTARQLIDYNNEPPENYPQIYSNVIDAVSMPGWLDTNMGYLFDVPAAGDKAKGEPAFFPFHQALSMQ